MTSGPGDMLALIRSGHATTRGDLQEATGLSRVTVAQRVDALLGSGLVREAGAAGPTGGRRASRLEFDINSAHILAATIDTTHTRTALTDLDGTVLAEETLDVQIVDGPEPVLAEITASLNRLRSGDQRPVAGIGISAPAPIDPASGRPSQPPIMPGWDGFPIAEQLSESFSVPARVVNDADAMAFGEQSTHAPRSTALCLVKVSTGIGTGIVIDGRVYQGVDGGSGDIGHVRLAEHGDAQCQCGGIGCLAAVASGRAVARQLAELGVPATSGRDVRALLQRGDLDAQRLTQQAGRRIGVVMATVVCLLNPGVLLLSGDLASTELLTGLRESLYPRTLPRATRNLDIRLGALGDDAAVTGVSRLVVDQVFGASAVNERLS